MEGDVIAPVHPVRIGADARVAGDVATATASPTCRRRPRSAARCGAPTSGRSAGLPHLVGLVAPAIRGVTFLAHGAWVGAVTRTRPPAPVARSARRPLGPRGGAGEPAKRWSPASPSCSACPRWPCSGSSRSSASPWPSCSPSPSSRSSRSATPPVRGCSAARSSGRPTTGTWPGSLAGWAVLRAVALVPVASWLAAGTATVLGGGALALVAWRSRPLLPPRRCRPMPTIRPRPRSAGAGTGRSTGRRGRCCGPVVEPATYAA